VRGRYTAISVTNSSIPCYSGAVSARHIALAAIAIAVLGMGVYLFLEVRSGSAQAEVVAAPPAAPAGPRASDLGPRPAESPPVKDTVARPAPQVKHNDTTPAPNLGPLEDKHDEPAGDDKANPKLDAIMDQANKAYDRQDFDEAKAVAGKVLAKMPNNIRMLRIMVSSSCIDGDVAVAQKYFPSLPKFDRDQMKVRCDRYGVTLTDPAQ
jgi:hypothetical protein